MAGPVHRFASDPKTANVFEPGLIAVRTVRQPVPEYTLHIPAATGRVRLGEPG